MVLVLIMFGIRVTMEQPDGALQETLGNLGQELRICDLKQSLNMREIST